MLMLFCDFTPIGSKIFVTILIESNVANEVENELWNLKIENVLENNNKDFDFLCLNIQDR